MRLPEWTDLPGASLFGSAVEENKEAELGRLFPLAYLWFSTELRYRKTLFGAVDVSSAAFFAPMGYT